MDIWSTSRRHPLCRGSGRAEQRQVVARQRRRVRRRSDADAAAPARLAPSPAPSPTPKPQRDLASFLSQKRRPCLLPANARDFSLQ